MNVTVLVDFENDSVRTALEVADALGDDLWGVRLDTSEHLVDRVAAGARWATSGRPASTRELVAQGARGARRAPATERVQIVVSGGFDAERIRDVRGARRCPVDAYGVGSSLIRGQNDFTADVVVVDGRPLAKVGRRASTPSPPLERC